MSRRQPSASPAPRVRCAVYTRKSSEEGLQQAFNSLDAQREAGEAYVASQRAEGWQCLPDRYDDGGFTGGNTDRPALQRLLADIAAGKVDCVVVYKVDRLSRSLLDFAKLMEVFENSKTSFVSVTQQFNTAHSMGRLMLNVLLSFAQFEREVIAERTRDKIAATRRKGKWTGGLPPMGYDVDPAGPRLVVNAAEAKQVQQIFKLYLQHGALLPVVLELNRRGWTNKRWTTRAGIARGGRPFDKTSLHRLLTSVLYTGKLAYKTEVHEGEHDAILDSPTWAKVQEMLRRNGATGATGGAVVRSRSNALLQGLIRCTTCDCAMCPTHTTKGNRRYAYYVCANAQKRGWSSCPSKSVPAAEIEAYVTDRVRAAARDPGLIAEVAAQARRHDEERLGALDGERRLVQRDLGRWQAEVAKVVASADSEARCARLADLHERMAGAERRLNEVNGDARCIEDGVITDAQVAEALAEFDGVWASLTPAERAEAVRTLIAQVDYDGAAGKVRMILHPTGLRELSAGVRQERRATA